MSTRLTLHVGTICIQHQCSFFCDPLMLFLTDHLSRIVLFGSLSYSVYYVNAVGIISTFCQFFFYCVMTFIRLLLITLVLQYLYLQYIVIQYL